MKFKHINSYYIVEFHHWPTQYHHELKKNDLLEIIFNSFQLHSIPIGEVALNDSKINVGTETQEGACAVPQEDKKKAAGSTDGLFLFYFYGLFYSLHYAGGEFLIIFVCIIFI